MKIFNGKTVVGLFDTDKDVEDAVSELQEAGFGAEDENAIQIVDEHRLAGESPIDAPNQQKIVAPSGTDTTASAVTFNAVGQAGSESDSIERNVQDTLTGKGLSDEEAQFHARQVARGGSLVIVETSEDRAEEAQKIMQDVNSRASVA